MHHYGANYHILDDLFLNSLLTQFCQPQTTQPILNELVEFLYSSVLRSCLDGEFPKINVKVPTRMTAKHPKALLSSQILDPKQKTVSVNLARAGTFPSHICYRRLNYVLDPQVVRQDHIIASRKVDAKDQVVGTTLSGSKIGGPIDDTIVLFPDPMGATGSTICSVVDHYKKSNVGKAKKFISLNMIITPEFIKKLKSEHPEIIVYAIRLDRGMSTQKALGAEPGKFWDEEKGLDETDYIVPGGGGIGEILNNSFV